MEVRRHVIIIIHIDHDTIKIADTRHSKLPFKSKFYFQCRCQDWGGILNLKSIVLVDAADSFLNIVAIAASTCCSGTRRTHGCATSSSGRKSRRPQGMLGQVGQRCVDAMTMCRRGMPHGPKMRGSVGPKMCMVGVPWATAR